MTRRIRSTSLHYFTLIELLVVIAIIALLAAILLPALRRALKEAREVVCMNNIHQLGLAATTYKDDYYGYYPPPVVFLGGGPTEWRAHPHDLKASDIGFIAPYIGADPSRFSDTTLLTEREIPGVLRCPFGNFQNSGSPGISTWGFKNVNEKPVTGYFYTGYAYWGRLEWTLPGYGSHTSVPNKFKTKYADRRCDPDAALWGDTVSWQNWGGYPEGGYTHTYSGRPKNLWDGPGVVFRDFERQNMGSVDGSVRIRWASEVNPDPSGAGVGAGLTGWGRYHWWYY